MIDNKFRFGFMSDVMAANPGFEKKHSALEGLLGIIENINGNPTGQQLAGLQTELDGIPVDKAEKYLNALQRLVDAETALCYTGIKTYQTSERNPRGANSLGGGWARYYSAGFYVKVKVYCIASNASPYEIGFAQHCTGKTDISTFSDKSRMFAQTAYAYPIGDCSSAMGAPFYHQGVSNGMALPAWLSLAGQASGFTELEMTDEFNNNGHPDSPFSGPGGRLAATISTIRREQSFTNWFIRRHTGTSATLLFRKVDFRITVAMDYRLTGTTLAIKSASTKCHIKSATTPAATATLPIVSHQQLNGIEKWWYTSPQNVSKNTTVNY
jgi:hypothetical protein